MKRRNLVRLLSFVLMGIVLFACSSEKKSVSFKGVWKMINENHVNGETNEEPIELEDWMLN